MTVFDGIRFNGKHSYRDYGMYLSEPPDFGIPEIKTQYVDIPGRDGALDYTEAATGEPKYSNRQMTFTFATEIKRDKREALRDELRNDLHGRKVKIIYDLDPDWYYTGRCAVSFKDVLSWKMKVVITVDAEPYKLEDGHTIITVEPTSFSAETIFLGQGTEAQHINSIFEFGTRADPQLDLTQFSKLTFIWGLDAEAPIGTPNLQIVDGTGNTFNSYTQQNTSVDGLPAMDLAINDITGITLSKVYRILCQGRPLVKLYATTEASATTMVLVDRMTVVPIWTASATCTVFINGNKFALPAGASQNFNCRLTEGENQVSFIADSTDVSIQIQFQNGRI